MGVTRTIRHRRTVRPMEQAAKPTELISKTRTPAAAREWTVDAPLLPNLPNLPVEYPAPRQYRPELVSTQTNDPL